ncbi:MAG: TIGR02281 family clan AA aspartic protease [Rhodobacteraceae bacterium]|nr:TIGR02281 family clan AA aspartic protease [Paracoccaceae bacterium]
MHDKEIVNLVYLSVLAATIAGSVLISRRGDLGKAFRQAGIWVFIFAAVVVIFASFQNIRQDILIYAANFSADGTITIPRKGDGHFRLTLKVNDKPVEFLVDTGASDIVLNRQDAVKIGFDPDKLDYWDTANTANGTVGIARVRLAKVHAGIYTDRNVQASVNKGRMNSSLLGMRYLKLFTSIEIKQDKMILKR